MTEVTDSEKDLVSDMLGQIKVPDDIKEELERGADQRAYIKDCMLRGIGTEEAPVVSTNYVYRYLTASMADLFPRDPTASLRPRDKMWGPEGAPPDIFTFSETCEKLLNVKAAHEFTGFARSVTRESLVVASGWGKLIWHEDYSLDPIGIKHGNEMDYRYAMYTHLYNQYKSAAFTKEDSEYERLYDLSETLKAQRLDELDATTEEDPIDEEFASMDPRVIEGKRIASQGLIKPEDLPEIPIAKNFKFELVEQEDVRWDWSINRFDNWMECGWIAHRVRMTSDEICARFGLDPDAIKIPQTDNDEKTYTGETTQDHREDIEDNRSDRTIDVWERWDKDQGRVYVFCDCVDEFLESYEPITWSGFHMLFPLEFNPVPGEFLGISDVDMQRALQDEINERRTNEREYISASLPRFIVAADAFDDGKELDRICGASPYSYTMLKTTEDPNRKIFTFQAKGADAAFFDVSKAVAELEVMAARPTAALGGANPGVTATQTAFSSSQLGGQVAQRRKMLEDYLNTIYRAMLEILLQNMDPLEVRAIVGPGAIWPEGRQAMLTELDLEVTTSLDNEPDNDKFLERFQTLAGIAGAMGRMPNPDMVLPKIAREVLHMDIPIEQWFPAPVQPMTSAGGSPGPNPGSEGHTMSGVPSMSELPGQAQTAQSVAGVP